MEKEKKFSEKELKERILRKERTDTIDYNKLISKPTEFLFTPYFPKGKIVIVMGNPGVSKSTFLLKIASIITNGGNSPISEDYIEQGNVVIQNVEDGSETLHLRLKAFNANFEFIKTIDEEEKDSSGKSKKLFLTETSRIEDALKRHKPKMFIIDPIQSYVGKTDFNNATQVRNILGPIAQLANKYECTFVIAMHLNKGDSQSLYRGLGSIDFIGVSRSVLMIGENPLNKDEILVEHIKHNLSEKGDSFGYKVSKQNNGNIDIIFLGKRDKLSFDDFLENRYQKKERPIEFAKLWLQVELAHSGINSEIIKEKAEKLGIKPMTLTRAKEDLNISSIPNGKQRDWVLPKSEDKKEKNDDWES